MPVIDADAAAFGGGFDGANDVGEELLLAFGGQGPDHVFSGGWRDFHVARGIGGLHDHDVFVIMLDGFAEIIFQVFERAVPVRVIALADDVEIHSGLHQMIKIPFRDGPIAAAIDVYNDADVVGGRGRGADAGAGGFQDADEMLPLFGIVVGFRRGHDFDFAGKDFDGGSRDFDLRIGPEEAAGDFISDLDKVRRGAGGFQGFDDMFGVAFGLFDEVIEIEIGPGVGFVLLLGIGPPIGIMKIEHERGASVFDAFGELGGVFEAVHAVARVDPDAEAEAGPAVFHE